MNEKINRKKIQNKYQTNKQKAALSRLFTDARLRLGHKFMHLMYVSLSNRADQALSTLAMRKFCEDKVSSSLQPSQNRYFFSYVIFLFFFFLAILLQFAVSFKLYLI